MDVASLGFNLQISVHFSVATLWSPPLALLSTLTWILTGKTELNNLIRFLLNVYPVKPRCHSCFRDD